ncbi:MAG: hypothetical protein DHS20C14_19600 [Phycisphaeraceae bacterium]|nr:MAG: hypothetical protein DHS20C14_19600 [Phycisphaeraceae bacterium]
MSPAMTSTRTSPPLRPAARLAGVRAYAPPAPRWAIDIKLDANEGPQPSPAALDAARAVTTNDGRRYPDTRALEATIARSWGVDPERVVVTNGADDAIDRLSRATLEPGRDLLTHTPGFEMIPRSARLAGAGVRTIAWTCGDFPEDAFRDAINPGIGLVALVSPNNPTGGVIPTAAITRVIDDARAAGSVVLLDLAYAEFANIDPTRAFLDADNAVIVRTFSKAFGLAGMRMGYAIAPASIVAWLRAAGGPYPVSMPALAAAQAAWKAGPNEEYSAAVRTERAELTALADRLGLNPLPSGANFVTLRTPRAAWIRDALGSLGIAVRLLGADRQDPLCRITLPGNGADFARLVAAIKTAADPEAILLDLDGVLADVSGSYRAAIIATARTIDVDLTPDDIARAKAAGDANNDWALTQRLLAERGVTADLAAITERFQRVYLGAEDAPALRDCETLIPSTQAVASLAARLPLAIVTGRPAAEARWFLGRAGIADAVRTLVAMEDAPAKPAPDPVCLALERLGVTHAWMLGDTPDDAAAARAAGVVPIGITAPGDDPGASRTTLEAAGVARVLARFEDMEGLLP